MIIFLAGVHGVGKGYLGKPVAGALGLRHATASELIREERGMTTWDASKHVSDIDANQKALVVAVNRIVNAGTRLLLDGHCALRNAEGTIQPVGVEVFNALGLIGIVLLEESAITIAKRIAERDKKQVPIDEIQELANAELSQARIAATSLRIPLSRLLSPTESTLRLELEKQFRI